MTMAAADTSNTDRGSPKILFVRFPAAKPAMTAMNNFKISLLSSKTIEDNFVLRGFIGWEYYC